MKTFGARSFSVAAPTLWNTLPSDIRAAPQCPFLKTNLKLSFLKKLFNSLLFIALVKRF